MPKLEIIKPGLMTSIQDLGRSGLAYYAIPHSGVMDSNAARVALLLLGQSEEQPLLECTSIAPQILFHHATKIVITGADFNWRINGKAVLLNQIIEVQKGDQLSGKFAQNGLRGYIAIQGHWKLDKVYNSYATYINARLGGHEGRLLRSGDIIEWESIENNSTEYELIPILAGPEFHFLEEAAQQQFFKNIFRIGRYSNRMGIRLEGQPISISTSALSHSVPVLPGFIQLPPSGLPIIVLQDGQTTGGYPRIAYIRTPDLSRLNQVPLGGEIRFVQL